MPPLNVHPQINRNHKISAALMLYYHIELFRLNISLPLTTARKKEVVAEVELLIALLEHQKPTVC